jgi:hypothetical protein
LVSTDEGATWQLHGRATPRDRHFDFRAAAEGSYLFKVQTLDASGVAFPSPDQPLRVQVDTSKPQAAIQADLDHTGNLIVNLRVFDDNLDLNTAMIRLRTDRDPQWREVPVTSLSPVGQYYEGQVEILVPQCREIAIVLSISDMAKNSGEANLLFPMPRTAANPSEMQLASTGGGGEAVGASIPGAVSWDPQHRSASPGLAPAPTKLNTLAGNLAPAGNQAALQTHSTASIQQGNFPTSPRIPKPVDKVTGPGQLTKTPLELELGPQLEPTPEELIIPEPLPDRHDPAKTKSGSRKTAHDTTADQVDKIIENRIDKPYYCRSRTFSLDYSVEALGGNALSEVELWGSEDNGRTWQKWGSDPDRVSPFDVKVGNDGLFGFRMVLVGAGGVVLGNPKPGEDADAWINVDTESPNCKIARAVYGVGSEAGMLVIDYACADSDLSEEAISLSWSASSEGPWTAVANGLQNTGLYLWKADSGLPNRVFLKLEAVDKAGNIGTHRLELPFDTKGLAPRGRIQGIRPIISPQ